ncbi:MAG: photosynthetic reaction center subunit H [Pseudomonadota bacterium]
MSDAFTQQLDLTAILFTLFWVFFLGLVYYLQREAKREGYPLDSDRSEAVNVQGFPGLPEPKKFIVRGTEPGAPTREVFKPALETPVENPALDDKQGYWGNAGIPSGEPMGANIGPGSWVDRADHAETTLDGRDQIVPMRVGTEFGIEPDDTDPRGFAVIAGDKQTAGTLHDIWCDRGEPQIRYYEVAVTTAEGQPSHKALVPVDFARVDGKRGVVLVTAITSEQFRGVPALASPDRVTLREEDRISAYYGGGMMYATPDKQEPLF